MKKVFTNSADVIHLFAQRSQSEARCGNVFFEGNRIYSYGHHYLLAEFIKNDKEEEAILINDSGYSVTTSKHISEVSWATRQYKQFFELQVYAPKVLRQLEELAHKLNSARKPELYINPAETLYSKMHEFLNWIGRPSNDLVSLAKIESIIKVFRGAEYSDYLNEQAAIIKKAEQDKLKQAKKDFRKELKDFFAYKRRSVYSNPTGEDYCRISQDGQDVETTQGVRVPIKAAKVLYQRIKDGKDIKGFDLNGYTVIGLNGILKIGCHKINLKNMNEIGEKILLSV